jgi:hypothetical protein
VQVDLSEPVVQRQQLRLEAVEEGVEDQEQIPRGVVVLGATRSPSPCPGWAMWGSTVQAWMGHASIATTNIYLHRLGTVADEAGLARLNGSGEIRGESSPKR